MTKIPTVQERPIPQAAPYNPQPVIVADTSAVPKAMDKLGDSLGKVGEAVYKIEDQKNKFDYTIARSKFLQKSVELQTQLNQDPDYNNVTTKYREGMSKIKQETLASLGANRYSEILDNEINLYENKNYNSILDLSQKKRSAFELAEADRKIEENLQAFSRSSDPLTREALINTSKELYASAIPIDNVNRPILIQENNKRINERFVETDLAKMSPYERLDLLSQENKKEGSNITKFLSADKRIDLYNRTLNEVKAIEKQKIDTSIVNNAILGNLTLDPTLKQNQDAVDAVWAQKQNDLIQQGANQQQILDSSLEIVERTGIMPTAIKSSLTANITNGNVQQRAAYSKYIADAADRNPKILNGLDTQTSSMAFSIANNLRSGLSQQQAVEWAMNDVNEAKKQQNTIRQKEWSDQSKTTNKNDKIKNLFEDEPGFDLFKKSPSIPPEMINEYNNLSKGFFVNNKVDLATANKLAEKTIRSQWGVTEIGGKKYTKYAPETIYGNYQNWVHKQLEEEFKAPIQDLNIEVDYSTVNSNNPAYYVFKKNNFGGVDIELDERNMPKRFIPSYRKQNEEFLRKNQENLEESKRDRKAALTDQKIREILPLGR